MAESTAQPLVARKYKLNEYKIQTLRVSLKEYEKNIVRQLTNPIYVYFVDLYKKCKDDARDSKNGYEGKYADLRCYQERLKGIPKWNTDQIKEETTKIINMRPHWQFSEILKTVFYIKSMILASIRPNDMQDEVYIGIPTPEAYLHRVLTIVAERIFAYPSLMRRRSDDDEETVAAQREQISTYITDGIINAIIDLVPTDEIVNKYVSRALQTIKSQDRKEVVDDMQKYGFEEHPAEDYSDVTEDDDYEDDEDVEDGEIHDKDDDYTDEEDVSEMSDDDYDDRHHRHHGRHSSSSSSSRPATRPAAAPAPPPTSDRHGRIRDSRSPKRHRRDESPRRHHKSHEDRGKESKAPLPVPPPQTTGGSVKEIPKLRRHTTEPPPRPDSKHV